MGLSERVDGFKPGLVIGTAVNNQDFWGILWGRPTAFLLLILAGDVRWITPNILTHVSNLLLLAGSALILDQTPTSWLLAVVCLNLSLTFDCADGQLARYRGAGSELGAYYDKVSDAVGMVILFSAVGWVVVQQTGELYYMLFAIAGAAAQNTIGYAKWVAVSAVHRRGAELPAGSKYPGIPWWEYLGRALLKVVDFAEPDHMFWISLGLIVDKLHWVLWLVAITQPISAVHAYYKRARQVAELDRSR